MHAMNDVRPNKVMLKPNKKSHALFHSKWHSAILKIISILAYCNAAATYYSIVS